MHSIHIKPPLGEDSEVLCVVREQNTLRRSGLGEVLIIVGAKQASLFGS